MDKNKFWLGGRLFNMAPTKVGRPNAMQGTSAGWATQTQHKTCPQVGHPNATQGTSASWAPQHTSATQMQGTSARAQVGRPNAMQGTSTIRPHQGRLFNTASPRLGAAMQRKARPQDGRPNATQGTSTRWVPKRKTDPQRKRPHKGALG
jgi:hypothetical protein